MPRPPAKAQSLADTLGTKITEGAYPPGTWLPSERELAEEHQVDRSTVRRTLRILAERGLITCRLPHDEEREKLEIDVNQPVLVLWRRCCDQRDHILDLTHRIVVGDRQELVYRYDSTT